MFTTAVINASPVVHYCTEDETGITGTICKSRGFYRTFWTTENPASCKRCVKLVGC